MHQASDGASVPPKDFSFVGPARPISFVARYRFAAFSSDVEDGMGSDEECESPSSVVALAVLPTLTSTVDNFQQ